MVLATIVLTAPDFSKVPHTELFKDAEKHDYTITVQKKKELSKFMFFKHTLVDHDGEHIGVTVEGTKGFDDPDVYISDEEKHPSDMRNSQRACRRYGDDVCLMNGSDYGEGDTIYVGVKCSKTCSFNIVVNYYMEAEIKDGEEHIVSLGKFEYMQVFKYIPQPKEGARHIKIASYPRMPIKNSLFVWRGGLPGGDNMFHQKVAMYDGKIVSLVKDDNAHFCVAGDETDTKENPCVFYIVVSSPIYGTFDLTARIEGEIWELGQAGNAYDFDSVGLEDHQCYKLNVKDNALRQTGSWKHLRLDLVPFSGNPDVYASFGKVPNKRETGDGIYTSNSRFYVDNLEIPRADVEAAAKKKGDNQYLFACVFGTTPASYSISMWYESNDAIIMRYGLTEYGSLKVDDDRRIYLVVGDPYLDHNYDLVFAIDIGAVDVYGVMCPNGFSASCSISKKKKNLLFDESNVDHDTTVEVAHDPRKCYKNPDQEDAKPECVYAIVVKMASTTEAKYSVVPMMNDITQTLKEGAYVYDDAHEHEKACFRFQLDDPTAIEVAFTLTPISGDPDLAVSTTIECPTLADADVFSAMGDELPDIVKFTKKNDEALPTTFYIGVRGFSYSYFSIYTKVTREKTADVPASAVELRNGRPQRDYIHSKEGRINYYKFELTIPDDEEGKAIRFQVTPVRGEFNVYITADGTRPSAANHNWSFDTLQWNNFLVMYSAADYDKHGKYEVAVETHNKNPDEDNPESFIISYVTEGSITKLMEGAQLSATGLQDMWDFYNIDVKKSKKSLVKISITSKDGNITTLVSSKFMKPRMDDANDDFVDDSSLEYLWGEGTISIDTDDYCADDDSEKCTIGIGVGAMSPISTYAIKYVTTQGKPTKLDVGLPQNDHLEKNTGLYYYTPIDSTSGDTEISLSLRDGRVNIYANLLRNPQSQISDWRKPTTTTADYKFEDIVHSVSLKSKDVKNECGPDDYCILYLLIQNPGPDPSNFTVTISDDNKIAALQADKKTKGLVKRNSYVYYSFTVSPNDSNATLLINVGKTSGADPDLVVSKGVDSRPTREKFDWRAETWASEFLQITLEDPYYVGKEGDEKTMAGTYILGVYSESEGEFAITVSTQVDPIFHLLSAESMDGMVANKEIDYYRFTTSYDSTLRVNLAIQSGNAHLEMNKILLDPTNHEFELNIMDRLPKRDKESDYSSLTGTRNAITIEEADHCQRCEYLIAVVSDMDSVTQYSITASMEGQYVSLTDGRSIKSFVSQGKKEWFLLPNIYGANSIEFSLTAYSGEAKLFVTTSDRIDERDKPTKFHWVSQSTGGSSFQRIMVGQKDSKFKATGSYVVAVEGVTDCQFSLGVNVNVEDSAFPNAIHLNDGEPIQRVVEGEGSYFLYSPPPNMTSPVDFALMMMDDSLEDMPMVYYTFVSTDKLGNQPPDLVKNGDRMYISADVGSVLSRLNLHENQSGTYIFLVASQGGSMHRVQVAISTAGHNVESLPMNFSSPGRAPVTASDKAEGTYYELFVIEDSRIYITAEPCNGEIQMRFADSYKDMLAGKFSEDRKSTFDGLIVSQKTVSAGVYYVYMTADSAGNAQPEVQFEIRWTAFPQTTQSDQATSPDLYSPGKHGRLNFDAGSRTMSWEEVQISSDYVGDLKRNENTEVTYQVFSSPLAETDRRGGMFSTVCGVFNFFIPDKEKLQVTTGPKFDLPKSKESKTYNVIASIKDNRFPQNIQRVAYVAEKYHPNGSSKVGYNKGLIVVLIIALVVAALFLALIFVIYKRYKRVEEQLTFEMSDVRNVAGVVGGGVKNSSRLMESERIIETSDSDRV